MVWINNFFVWQLKSSEWYGWSQDRQGFCQILMVLIVFLVTYWLQNYIYQITSEISVADPEGAEGTMPPPGPVKISHKKDCIPVRCILPACCPHLPACTALGGGLFPGGVSAPGGNVCSRGFCFQGGTCLWSGGVYPSMQWGRPPCEQNDRQVQKYYLAPNFVCGR